MTIFENIPLWGSIFIILSFISGSVPYGLVYSLLRGVDIRKVGSGNIGATNVTRQFGLWQGFVPVLILDMLKGALPIIIFRVVALREANPFMFDSFEIFIGLAAILGHVFSPFLKFKGGKGVATTGGVLFTWNFIVASMVIGAFALAFFTFGKKIVGRASIVAAICFPFIAIFTPSTTLPMKATGLFLGAFILITHRSNIKDWISGEDIIKLQKSKEEKAKRDQEKKGNKE